MDNRTNTFTHNNHTYDLDKVRLLVRPEKAFLLHTSELLWVHKYDKPDEQRVLKAKIRYPLLVSRYRGKWTVVDGLHRLELYRRRGITIVPVKHVTDRMLELTEIHKG